MPAFMTHDIFAREVYNKIDKKIQNKFNNELPIYQAFSQSHDILFYYKSINTKENNRINFIGKIGHRRKTQDYLINIVKIIKKYHLEEYQPDIAYLFGSITHYVLDSTLHPLIFYKTGIYDPYKKLPKHLKYKGMHALMERTIDSYYYKKYYKKDYKYCKIFKDIKKPKLSIDLITLINMVYKETYNLEHVGIYHKKGIKDFRIINRLFIQDKLGIKLRIYKLLEKIQHKNKDTLACFSTSYNYDIKYLNLEHKKWNHPCDKERIYTDSIEDLYNESIEKCLKIFNEVYKVLYENKDIDLLKKVIPNISYGTGLDLKNNKEMKYFEY